MLLDGVDALPAGATRELHGLRAECPQRVRRLGGALVANAQPGEVGGRAQRPRAGQGISKRAGEHAESDQPERAQSLQHPGRDRALKDVLLERVAVNQERGLERVEAGDPDRVPGPAAYCAQVCLAGPDVADEPRFGATLALPPLILELDAQRPVGAAGDLVDEGLQLLRREVRVRHGQHHGDAVRAADLVEAGATAARDDEEQRQPGRGLRMAVIAGRFTVLRP